MAVRFQVSDMEEMTIWEQYTVTLNRDPRRGFGIAISGGKDRPIGHDGDNSVIVSDVVRGGPADGRLQTRDRIVMVNGVSMENVASAFAIQTLKSCAKTANVTVKRPRKIQIPITKLSQSSNPPVSGSPQHSASVGHYGSNDGDYGHSEQAASPTWSSGREHRYGSYPDDGDHNRGYDGDSSSERSSEHYRSQNNYHPRQSSRERRPSQDGSHERPYRRHSQDSGSGYGQNGRYSANGYGYDQDDGTNGLALVSGFKRLPSQDVPMKPIKSVLVKHNESEEYGLKLGSQIFIKHITDTGLAAQDSSLQEGDLILKINGVASENMSLADTKRLIERSEGKLTLTVLRDNRQFLVNIPQVTDSDSERSSRIEDISDLGSYHSPPPSLPALPPLDHNAPRSPTLARMEAPKEERRINGEPLTAVELNSTPVYAPRDALQDTGYRISYNVPSIGGSEEPQSGYSPDPKLVQFMKGGSIGLRLAGGNDVGIFVAAVQDGSPAAREGIKEGDQILQVNETSFQNLTREEAVQYLMTLPQYEEIIFLTQGKQDIYRKMVKSNVGDSFHIRTHFDHESETPSGLSFTRGEVFHVVDTMYRGKLGSWLAVRMGQDLQELKKGIIPNKSRAEQIASLETVLKPSISSSSGPRAEFWKLRGLRGAKKNLRKSREDLAALTSQAKYPPYERVVLREASFKRPVVVLGPITDIALQKLSTEMPDQFEVAESVPRAEGSSKVIKLQVVRQIAEKNKHALLDITPTAVEHLNYVQFYPIVVFCNPENKQGVKAMRQWLCPESKKSSRRLYTQALKMRKYCSHLFTATINLSGASDSWYRSLKEIIKTQQARPIWTAEDMAECTTEQNLDMLNQQSPSGTDYLSCDSRANSDYEDTDGEGGAYTDTEMEEVFEQPALARSSEPVEAEPYYLSQPAGLAYRSAEDEDSQPQGQWTRDHETRAYEADALRKKFTRARSYSSEQEEEEDQYWGGPATDL
ncbi:LOW QUALITY PROTEIN: tight junction protein ZO-3 [Rhinatrema bivittatum]|uniref:LOW QUALITY PROTEIN: tight junction protein ZO-3 n=1 Tax=Rhinatrema bivittatum TaxID=194408 RepID=UPI001127C330|nr:LOW QUALITY PROTEIN: tight junction protein ZO-3 [Rhinatrema bivittatum]